MKLTTVLMFGVFTLGSAYTQADHLYDNAHGRQAHHKHTKHCYHKARGQYRSVHNYKHKYKQKQKHKRVRSRHQRDQYADASYARVVSVEPVYRYYKEPVSDHSCIRSDRRDAGYNSHTSTVLGAVIGGALGHRIGDSHGDPNIAAVAGGLLGASVGRDVGHRASYKRSLRVEGPCRIRQHEETRRQLVEYKVSYRYNGQVHLARMDYDPGEWVKLDVNVTPA